MSDEQAIDTASSEVWAPAPEVLRVFTDPAYRPPDKLDVRGALKACGLTGVKAGELLGVDGRTIRRYTGGERPLPYAMWRLLLIYAGYVNPPSRE